MDDRGSFTEMMPERAARSPELVDYKEKLFFETENLELLMNSSVIQPF